ncbi:cupredoxin domain-containing protein [Rhodanobacter sp. B2A1Ga4]|uniref:cupredoxin domain-containing protein n=1 Tax=Rhodanobacter sp. B2A1Ga4 TaxID=2778647 RepID=UPI001B361919|nr:cupredoxin domain-containing protein [Rhodanobacter sp. B2A1Ga4]MBQ4853148.1 cupredoxin domain-containing protein [Rhodanobacter sp. B2A1Ga4]
MQRFLIVLGLMLASVAAMAGDLQEYKLVIQNHVYQPTELKVPAGTKFKLVIENRDASPEEFESTEFNREKIVMPNSSAHIYVGPLAVGHYKFFGDFHQDTAQGTLVVE